MKPLLTIALASFLFSAGFAQEPTKPTEPAVPEKKEEVKKEAEPTPVKEVTVVISTSMGDIQVELDSKNAPNTVKNFLTYVDAKHYDGTIFHRVIGNFMIQGGGFEVENDRFKKKKTNPPIKNESARTPANKRGTLAMARTNDLDSATSQFFINVVDNASLDNSGPYGGYATFGKVTKGMEIVDKIKAVKTGIKNGMQDVPNETVTIKSIKRAK